MNCNASNYDNRKAGDGCRPDLNRMPIAMAYVPWQYFQQIYEPDKALQIGTIFPELNKPFTGRKGCCNGRCL